MRFFMIFKFDIYIQKAWHFSLRDVFMYKKPDTSQKARLFALRFYIQKAWHFALRDFSAESNIAVLPSQFYSDSELSQLALMVKEQPKIRKY